jgi:hypothetical protein
MAVFVRTDMPSQLPILLGSLNRSSGFGWYIAESPVYLRAGSSISLSANTDNIVYSKDMILVVKSEVRALIAGLIGIGVTLTSFSLTAKLIVDGVVVASHSLSDSLPATPPLYSLIRPLNVAFSYVVDAGAHNIKLALNPSQASSLYDLMVIVMCQDTIIDVISEYTPLYSESFYSYGTAYPSFSSAANTEVEVASLSLSLPKASHIVIIGTTMLRQLSTAATYGRLYIDGLLAKELSTAPSQAAYGTLVFFPIMKVATLGAGSHTVSLRVYSSASFWYWTHSSYTLLNYVALSPP